jgi:hypothetical protein
MKVLIRLVNFVCDINSSCHENCLNKGFDALTPFEQEYLLATGKTKFRPFGN